MDMFNFQDKEKRYSRDDALDMIIKNIYNYGEERVYYADDLVVLYDAITDMTDKIELKKIPRDYFIVKKYTDCDFIRLRASIDICNHNVNKEDTEITSRAAIKNIFELMLDDKVKQNIPKYSKYSLNGRYMREIYDHKKTKIKTLRY